MDPIYRNEEFARFWNNRVGDEGEDYKRFVLDPVMLEHAGSMEGKAILELGCGNGYMAPTFLKRGAKSVIMVDIAAAHLESGRARCPDPRVQFVQHDATTAWPWPDASVDLLYSNMMLNEVADIKTPLAEAARVLKPGGRLLLSVLHPACLLFYYARERVGASDGKILGLSGYFDRAGCKFVMGARSATKPLVGPNTDQEYQIPQNKKTISDYFQTLVASGFRVSQLLEPELTPALIQHNPSFAERADRPTSLVFICDR